MKKNDKVIICGFAPSYKLAPINDESFDVWGLNELYAHIPRWDRWFDLHTLERVKTVTKDGQRLATLAAMDCPVYTQKVFTEIPNSVEYPLAEMTHEFFGEDTSPELAEAFAAYRILDPGSPAKPYLAKLVAKHGFWTNTVSYMIALAIHEGYKEIHVYGVDMAADSEFAYQRPSCEYFLGFARGRGIKVYLPTTADLLKSQWIYGYDEVEWERFRAKMTEKVSFWQQQHANAIHQRDQQNSAAEQFSGAIQAGQDIVKVFG